LSLTVSMNLTQLAPKAGALCEITRIDGHCAVETVTQCHRFWYWSKARMWLL